MRFSPRIASLVLGTLFVPACAPTRPAPVVTPPRVPVLDDAAVTALAELLRAEDRRTLDPERFDELLRHPEPEVRARAALAAGRIGDARAGVMLLRAVDDSTVSVGASAAFALGLLGDTASAIVYTLVRKVHVDWSEEDPRAVEAVAAFGLLGTPAAHSALQQVLLRYAPAGAASSATTPAALTIGEAGKQALLVVARMPRAQTAADLVVPHLGSADPDVRWRAAYALSRIGSPRTAENVLALLDDASPLVRALAARGLRAAVADSAGLRARVTAALVAALADPDPHVQINAAGALGTFEDSALAGAFDAIIASPDANVRLAAVQALARSGGGAAVRTLARIAQDDAERLVVRGAALTGVIHGAPALGIGEAEPWVASADWLTRLYATRALAGASWSASGRHLRRLAEDADSRVATAAIRAVTAGADTLSAPYALYLQALAAPDADVRAAATAGLARRASPADLAVLMQAYDRAQRDTANDAALAAVDALAGLQRRGVPVSRAFFLRFPPSPDREVRARVARLFEGEGWPLDTIPPPVTREAGFYERVVRELVVPDLLHGRRPRATVHTGPGTFVIELRAADAPLTVLNFITLASNGYFPSSAEPGGPRFRWHRVVPNFVLQDGDGRGDGSGGPGYRIRDEINGLRYGRGTVGMALSGPDTGGSQFFITHSPQPHLDGGYTIFGAVISGMDVADRVVQDDPIFAIQIER